MMRQLLAPDRSAVGSAKWIMRQNDCLTGCDSIQSNVDIGRLELGHVQGGRKKLIVATSGPSFGWWLKFQGMKNNDQSPSLVFVFRFKLRLQFPCLRRFSTDESIPPFPRHPNNWRVALLRDFRFFWGGACDNRSR
jgi:hypothetical protein